jgi:RNA polymerase sigma-70 factor (ECF subfamily)
MEVSESVLNSASDSNQTSEIEIVQRVLAGQTNAYGEIFSRHRERAFALAFQYVRDHEEAKDLVQEAFVKAYQNLGKFNLQRSFRPWILAIVRNLAIDFLRKRKRISPDELPSAIPDRRPQNSTEQRVLRAEVWEALSKLNENQREIIFLKDYQGHSYLEIAEILSIPLGTVMSRLHHARRNLIATLGINTK